MLELRLRPEIHGHELCADFVGDMNFTTEDVILTNRYIYEPFLGRFGLPCQLIFQEDYGKGEPDDIMAQAMLNDFLQMSCKRLVAIGGGTVIDLAKVLAVGQTGASIDEMYLNMSGLKSHVPLDIVPTTCGTGSEVTNIAILGRTALRTKMGMVSEGMYARRAILVPEFLNGLPWNVFATSSLDALVHAVESWLSPKASPYTMLFSRKAMEIIINSYKTIRANGQDARKKLYGPMLSASNYAGIAFGSAGCAAVHALSYPLGGLLHVPHGEANYSIFMEVLELYARKTITPAFAEFTEFVAQLLECPVEKTLSSLSDLLEAILPLKSLGEYGMTEKDARKFSRLVMDSQQRLLANNPMPLDEQEILGVYLARI